MFPVISTVITRRKLHSVHPSQLMDIWLVHLILVETHYNIGMTHTNTTVF